MNHACASYFGSGIWWRLTFQKSVFQWHPEHFSFNHLFSFSLNVHQFAFNNELLFIYGSLWQCIFCPISIFEPVTAGGCFSWAWFFWMFIPFKREFFLPTLARCWLIVLGSLCPISLEFWRLMCYSSVFGFYLFLDLGYLLVLLVSYFSCPGCLGLVCVFTLVIGVSLLRLKRETPLSSC